jgi:hypothetical protein
MRPILTRRLFLEKKLVAHRSHALVLAFLLCSPRVFAQKKPGAQNDRLVLEQILQQTYQPSLVGKQMLGIGGETDIRRAGTIVVIQRPGLYGSMLHTEPASSAITGLKAELFRGHEDYVVPVGERYYVTAVAVSSSTVLVGLISARTVSTQVGTGRLWTTLSFNFPDEVLAAADKEAVFREIDQWFIPEGRAVAVVPAAAPVATPVAAPAAISAAPAPMPAALPVSAPPSANASREMILSPAMSRDQVLQLLGAPERQITFGQQQWLIYSGIVAALKDGKLDSIQTAGQASVRVNVQSDPSGAEIFLDDQLVGSTPSAIMVSPGKHIFRLHAAGHADWVRQVTLLSGSDLSLSAALDRN